MFSSFLRAIDIYSIPFNSTLFNNPTYKSRAGGVFTIITIISFILSFIYFTKDFYQRKNPKFINQRLENPIYVPQKIIDNSIFAAMRIEDSDSNPVDSNGYLSFEFNYNKLRTTKDGNGTVIFVIENNHTIPEMDCDKYDRKKMRMKSERNFTNYTCMDLNNLTLGGYWDSSFVYYIDFNVKPCSNKTSKNCKSFNEIEKFIRDNGLYIGFYTNFYSLFMNDFENPLQISEEIYYVTLENKIGKSLHFNYKKALISQDLGIVLPSITEYSVYGIDSFSVDNYYYELREDVNILKGFLYLTKKTDTFSIIYIKIQEALAYLGGIINLILLLFDYITQFFNKYERNIEIINELFDFSELGDKDKLKKILEKREIKEEEEKENEIHNTSNVKNSKFFDFSEVNVNVDNITELKDLSQDQWKIDLFNNKVEVKRLGHEEIEGKLKEEMTKRDQEQKGKYKLKISLCLRLKNIFCSNILTKEEKFLIKMYDKSSKIISSKVDMMDYLKFTIEYIYLKNLIFSFTENLSFIFLEKPKIYEKTKLIKLLKKSILTPKKNKMDIVKNFLFNKELSDRERKIYQYLSHEIKEIIQRLS